MWREFLWKTVNLAVWANITASRNWAIGYYLQSEEGFVLVLMLNWFSGLPVLKGSTQFPLSPGHIFLFASLWLTVYVWSYYNLVPLTKPEKTNPAKKVTCSLWFGGSWSTSHGAHTVLWVVQGRREWMNEAGPPLQVAEWCYIGSEKKKKGY